jgi:hypothetical protein
VRRQTAIGEVDAPAIEELATGRDRDEDRRLTVLGDADGRGSLRSSSRHVFLRGVALQLTPSLTLVRKNDRRLTRGGPSRFYSPAFDAPPRGAAVG